MQRTDNAGGFLRAPIAPEWIARILRVAADEAEKIAAEQRAERRTWVDQSASQLGRRRHVAAVRRRIAAGLDGASMIGRRALLAPQALDEELEALVTRKPAPKPETTTARLERKLALVAGTR